ncbi:MAG: hypothetical protein U0263_08825 [Polyangiaceae bacterium]
MAGRGYRLCLVLGVIFTCLTATARANAGKTSGGSPTWELPRSPFVPHRATPSALECEIDEDDDGLDDEMEGLLAERFVPVIKFAKKEHDRRTGAQYPGNEEPFVAFNAWPDATGITIKYATLYADDGGYYDHVPLGQGTNSHPGDSSALIVKVVLTEKPDGRWIAELVYVDGGQKWARDVTGSDNPDTSCSCELVSMSTAAAKCICGPPKQVETLKLDNEGHPIVFASWGKHHYYLNVVEHFIERYTEISLLPGVFIPVVMMWDQVDGTGAAIRPVLRMRYPTSTSPIVFTNVGELRGPETAIGVDWATECEHKRTVFELVCECDPAGGTTCPPKPPAQDCLALSIQVALCDFPPSGIDTAPYTPSALCRDRLDPPGKPHASKFIGSIGSIYFGASFLSGELFCGGQFDNGCESTPLAQVGGRGGPKQLDLDGDGVENHDDLCPTHGLAFDHTDTDGDGVGQACDPNPKYRDTWIGPGFPLQNLRAYKSASALLEDPARRGWLDTDEDSVPNGADFCPATAGGTADQLSNWNLWAEKSVFVSDIGNASYAAYDDDGKDLSPYRPRPNDTGFIERGSLCDPYETTKIWQQPASAGLVTGDVCQPFTQFGTPKIQVEAVPLRGVSSNNLVFSGKTYAERLEEAKKHGAAVRVDPRRCACSAFDKSQAVRDVVCFDRDSGECPRTSPLPQQLGTNARWFPHEFPNCARKTDVVGGVTVDRCLPFTTTAPVAASAFCPPGQSCPKVPGDLTPKVHHLGWHWMVERASYPGHFRPEWFQVGVEPLTGKPYSQATVGFTFATRTFVDGVIPGTGVPQDSDAFSPKAKTFNRSVGQHADVDPWIRSDDATKSENQLSAQDKLRRTGSLRTHFSESFAQPSEPHLGLNKSRPTECVRIHESSPEQTVWYMPFKPCVPIETCFGDPAAPPWALSRSSVDPAAVRLVELGSGLTQAVQVAQPGGGLASLDCLISNCGPPDVGAGWQITALPGGIEAGGYPRLVATASGRARSDGIEEDVGDRFWVLAPVGVEEGVVAFSVVATGSAPAGTSRAEAFLGSDDGRHVVAFSEERLGTPGWLRVFDAETGSWKEVSLEPAPPARTNAAYVLREHGLYRAGGETGAALASDAIAIDWRSGHFETIVAAGQLPARARPLLTWDVQGEGLIYGGGVGADGAAHNDLWSVRAGHAVAVRLVANTAPITRPLDRSGLVFASGFTGEAIWWESPGYVPGAGVRHSVRRSELGVWVAADLVTKAALARTCTDETSARICASGSEWWRTPGNQCSGGTCELGRTEQASTSVLPGAHARVIALEQSTLWVGRGKKLERWSLLEPGAAVKVDSVDLGGRITAMAARDGVVLVATSQGLSRVTMVEGALQVLQSGIKLCRVESVTSVGLAGWVVATSAGAALLQPTETGELTITDEVELEKSKGKWKLEPVKKSAMGGKAKCSGDDGHHHHDDDDEHDDDGDNAKRPARVTFDGRNVELARGEDLFRLSWGASGLALVDTASVNGKIWGIRATSDRVYLVTKRPHNTTTVVLLLGNELQLDGTHDVAAWVDGEQSGPYRARITPSDRVEVAWLVQ